MSIPFRKREIRQLDDLHSVGPATIKDLELLGITSVEQLVGAHPQDLYRRLCTVTGARHDPCVEDVFSAAVAQARDPRLPLEQCRWWYWSQKRKTRGQ
jgi:hypothetical protein